MDFINARVAEYIAENGRMVIRMVMELKLSQMGASL